MFFASDESKARCCGVPLGCARVGQADDPGAKLDLMADIFVRVDDVTKPVSITLLSISQTSARFRSCVVLPPQAGLSFKWVGRSREPVVIHGHVCDVTMVDKRTAEYTVDLVMPAAMKVRLEQDIAAAQRRKTVRAVEPPLPPPAAPAAMPVPAPLEVVDEIEYAGRSNRNAYRAFVQLPTTVRIRKKGRWVPIEGEVRDLSVGGVLLLLQDEVAPGSDLELAFSLPGDEKRGTHTKEVVEMTPFGERRVKKGVPAKAAASIETRGRVIRQTGTARNGMPLYGVTFIDLAGAVREQIARWIHAHQIGQLRKMSGTGMEEPRPVARLAPARKAARSAPLRGAPLLHSVPEPTTNIIEREHDPFGLGFASEIVPSKSRPRPQGEADDVFGLGTRTA